MSTLDGFSSKAWLLDGPIYSLPGLLNLNQRKVSFLALEQGTFSNGRFAEILEANGKKQSDGRTQFPLELFSVSIDSISQFKIPWYYFGAGAKLQIDNRSFRFSFVKPQNTVEPTYYSEAFHEWRGGAGQEEVNIAEGKASGKTWKLLLSNL